MFMYVYVGLNCCLNLLREIGWGVSYMYYGKMKVTGWREACCMRWMAWEVEEEDW